MSEQRRETRLLAIIAMVAAMAALAEEAHTGHAQTFESESASAPITVANPFEGTWAGRWPETGAPAALTVGRHRDGTPNITYCYDTMCARPRWLKQVHVDAQTLRFTWGGKFTFTRIGNALNARYERGDDIAMNARFTTTAQ